VCGMRGVRRPVVQDEQRQRLRAEGKHVERRRRRRAQAGRGQSVRGSTRCGPRGRHWQRGMGWARGVPCAEGAAAAGEPHTGQGGTVVWRASRGSTSTVRHGKVGTVWKRRPRNGTVRYANSMRFGEQYALASADLPADLPCLPACLPACRPALPACLPCLPRLPTTSVVHPSAVPSQH
jgi:hypothetical protein